MDIAWNVHMASLHQTYCTAYVMKILKEQKCAIMLRYQDVSYFVHKKSAKLNK